MSNYILFVFEGERTEKKFFDSLRRFYLNESNCTILIALYGCDIYCLYQEMNRDNFLDLFPLLKEKEGNRVFLSGISRDNVSEIYLFFDYDGHSGAADDRKISKLLNYFNEETENGKLYLSYPIVEALKHLKKDVDFKDVVVPCRKNIQYKMIVNDNSDNNYQNIGKLDRFYWNTIICEHCKKLNHLMTDQFHLPDQ